MCQVPNGQLDPQKLIHTVSNHGLDEEDRKLKKTSDSISLLLKLRPSQTHHQHHQIANNNRYPKNTIYKNIIANAAMTNFVSVITLYNFDPSHTLFCPIFKSKWYFRLRSYLLGPLALLQTESRFGFFIIKLKWGDINVMVVMMKSNHSPKGKKPTINAVQTEFQVTADDFSLSPAAGTIMSITMIAMDTLIFVGVLWPWAKLPSRRQKRWKIAPGAQNIHSSKWSIYLILFMSLSSFL